MPADTASNHGHVLVVPRSPGPLLELAPALAQRDDLDELLDDLFGEPLPDGPGAADIALVVLGVLGQR